MVLTVPSNKFISLLTFGPGVGLGAGREVRRSHRTSQEPPSALRLPEKHRQINSTSRE